ncbi:DUF3667 domain-containing protein [Aquabacterium sp.]|uniref:DUF3667 domain-containing protein n=1 Tax=Aquabacterium sp. TaxID=1872578 RepID=UPI0037850202
MTATPAPPAHCLNCEQPFGVPRPHYCPACGQETNIRPPTVGEFIQQFGGSYIAVEGALWRSLKLLLLKPGQLTREYLDGRRRRYVLPLRLYLTISVLALLAIRLGAQFEIRSEANGPPITAEQLASGMADVVVIDAGSHRAGLDHGRFFCEGLPHWVCQRLQRKLDVSPQALAAEMRALPEQLVQRFGSAMFFMVPLFALGMKLLYLNRRMRYTEHLVYALHLHAFWFIALALTVVPAKPASDIAVLAIPVYAFLAERRVYRGRWWTTLLRECVLSASYFTALTLALIVVLTWVILG